MPSGIYKRTEKHKAQSVANLPKIPPKYWLGKRILSHQGFQKGNKLALGRHHSDEVKKIIALAHLGKPKLKIRGKNHYAWKGGITPLQIKVRNSIEYKNWRDIIFKRDKYTCRECGARNGNGKRVVLNAHHIHSFADFPSLRFVIENGITLCRGCHEKTFKKIN